MAMAGDGTVLRRSRFEVALTDDEIEQIREVAERAGAPAGFRSLIDQIDRALDLFPPPWCRDLVVKIRSIGATMSVDDCARALWIAARLHGAKRAENET